MIQRIMKAMVLAGIGLLLVSDYAVATRDIYKGELDRERTKTGTIGSNELWLIRGDKGYHVIITLAVDEGKAPPEMYLYPPDSKTYQAHSEVFSSRTQVIDYELKSKGDYAVVVHPCNSQASGKYKIAYATLKPDESFSITPDDPSGDLLNVTAPNRPPTHKFFIDNSGGVIPGAIVFNLVTFGLGPGIFAGFTVVDRAAFAVEDYDRGIKLASRDLVEPADQCDVRIDKT